MKEPGNSQVSTANPGRKRKKRKGGLNFSNSKQRRRRELRKKEQSFTHGNDPPTDLSKTGEEAETGTCSKKEELERIEKEGEKGVSQEQSMGGSEHQSDLNSSESEEETKKDSMNTVSLVLRIMH